MAKKNRKRYSVAERENFHAQRVHSQKATEGQRTYSRQWLSGVRDEHAQQNLRAVRAEIATLGRNADRDCRIILNGYRNGLQAQLRDK